MCALGGLLYGGSWTARCAAAFIETVYGFSIIVGWFIGEGAAASGEEIVWFSGGGVSCVKLVEAVAVVVGGIGSERVVVELLQAILSFLKRGILADVYIEAVKKNIDPRDRGKG